LEVKAMAAKDPARACPKLEEAVKLEPKALGARFLLAECYEASGRLASAWGAFLQAEAAAVNAGKRQMRDEAHERAERLKPLLAQVVIAVPDEVEQLPVAAGWLILRDERTEGPSDLLAVGAR
jgi:thioredoxin-like negative regulator of GroEL